MAYLEEVYQAKNKIITLLLNDTEIVKTIDPDFIEIPDDLINENVYRSLYIPDAQSEAKTYICLEIEVPKIYNKLIKYLDIHIWIFSSQSISDTGNGYTRVDYIQSRIDKIMNGNYDFGIDEVGLRSSYIFRPNAKFGGKELIYRVPEFNQKRCGENDTVKSRK